MARRGVLVRRLNAIKNLGSMKRAIVYGWDTHKALEDATALGLANETLKQFFLAQIQQRKR